MSSANHLCYYYCCCILSNETDKIKQNCTVQQLIYCTPLMFMAPVSAFELHHWSACDRRSDVKLSGALGWLQVSAVGSPTMITQLTKAYCLPRWLLDFCWWFLNCNITNCRDDLEFAVFNIALCNKFRIWKNNLIVCK